MRDGAIKLTTAAVCTALAVMFCAMTLLPLSIMPLYFAAFCIFLACKRSGLIYGLLCTAATVGIMFAFSGLSIKWLFLVFMFAPYGILTYFIHRFTYFKIKWAVVRIIISVLYFNLMLGLVYVVVMNALSIDHNMPLTEIISHLGGYWVLAIVATVVLVPLDFIFSTMSIVILKRLPGGGGDAKVSHIEQSSDDGRKYDIFGYAIDDKSEQSPPNEPDTKDGEEEKKDK